MACIYQLEEFKAFVDAIDDLCFTSAVAPVGLKFIPDLTMSDISIIEEFITERLRFLGLLTQNTVNIMMVFLDALRERIIITDSITEDTVEVNGDVDSTPNGAEDDGAITFELVDENTSDGEDFAMLTPSDDDSDYVTAPEE